jgi:hypothetical protein
VANGFCGCVEFDEALVGVAWVIARAWHVVVDRNVVHLGRWFLHQPREVV